MDKIIYGLAANTTGALGTLKYGCSPGVQQTAPWRTGGNPAAYQEGP